eukprot:752938-Hanusia_phi.AAC.11
MRKFHLGICMSSLFSVTYSISYHRVQRLHNNSKWWHFAVGNSGNDRADAWRLSVDGDRALLRSESQGEAAVPSLTVQGISGEMAACPCTFTEALYTEALYTDALYTDELYTDELYTDELYTDALNHAVSPVSHPRPTGLNLTINKCRDVLVHVEINDRVGPRRALQARCGDIES